MHDLAVFLFHHIGDDCLGHQEVAAEIDVDHSVKLLVGHLVELSVLGDPGVVDQNIDPPELLGDGLDHFGHLLLVGDVDDKGTHGAEGRQVLSSLSDLFGADIADCDFSALFQEQLGGCKADAGGGTGDDGDTIFQFHNGGRSFLLCA